MKKWYSLLFAASFLMCLGCNGNSPPGGPGAGSKPGTKTPGTTGSSSTTESSGTTESTGTTGTTGTSSGIGKLPENTFSLDVPTFEKNVNQGQTRAITIGIHRGTNFDQDIKLDFGKLPMGITIDPASPVVKAGDKNVQINVMAANDAALGEHTITVTGTPARSGAPTSTTFKIQVKKP